jgi:hypothetical protein
MSHEIPSFVSTGVIILVFMEETPLEVGIPTRSRDYVFLIIFVPHIGSVVWNIQTSIMEF